jgi:hypothetical protein
VKSPIWLFSLYFLYLLFRYFLNDFEMLQFPLYTIIIIIRIAFIGLQIYVFQDLSKLIRLGFFLMKSERKNLKFSTRQKRKPRRRESRDSAVTFCARDAREPCV